MIGLCTPSLRFIAAWVAIMVSIPPNSMHETSLSGSQICFPVHQTDLSALAASLSAGTVNAAIFILLSSLLIFFAGFNDDPIARRVRSIPTDFFLLTNRFHCNPRRNDPGCGTSYQGTDPHIIAQLPSFVQPAFPGMFLLLLYE
jgi:hypothetical protein